MLGIQAQSEVIRNLASGRHDDTVRILQVEDIHDALESEFVKIKAVAHVVVGRYSFRIVVNHHTAITFLADSIECLHAAPVELNRRTDTVSARAQHNDALAVAQIVYIIGHATIGQIQIVCLRRIFGSQGVNLLHHGYNATLLAMTS